MPGLILELKVAEGEKVFQNQPLVVIEAMKMENEIQAPKDGIVVSIHVQKGDSVTPDETLIEIQ